MSLNPSKPCAYAPLLCLRSNFILAMYLCTLWAGFTKQNRRQSKKEKSDIHFRLVWTLFRDKFLSLICSHCSLKFFAFAFTFTWSEHCLTQLILRESNVIFTFEQRQRSKTSLHVLFLSISIHLCKVAVLKLKPYLLITTTTRFWPQCHLVSRSKQSITATPY